MIKWIEKNILAGKRPYILILALGFLVYARTLLFNFVYLDDNALILDNFGFIRNLGNILEAFRHDVFFSFAQAYYRPIMTLSLIFDAQIGGNNPLMYHFTNIIIHLIAACLLFLLLKKLNYRHDLALFFAAVFAVIPVLSQAVAWIPGRNDSLLVVFIFASFIYFLKFLESKKKSHIFGHIIFFALALFTKESALVLPLLIFYYLHFIYREKTFYSNKKWLVISWTGIILIWFWLRHLAFVHPIAMSFSVMIHAVIFNSPAIIQMIGKIIFPFNLSVMPIIQDTTFVYGILAIIIISLLIFFTKQKRWNYLIFGALWFLFFLLPSFIRPDQVTVADFIEHRLYLPLMGFFIIFLETSLVKKYDYKNKLTVGISIFILLFFSVITIMHLKIFEDRLAFWQNAVANSPHAPLAHRNLGAMYYLEKQPDKAEPEFEKALALNSNEAMAHNNLGLIYMDRGEFSKAEPEFNTELQNHPYYDAAYFNLGLLEFKMKKYTEAEDNWKKTLALNPNFTDAIEDLAALYYQEKRIDEAIFYIKELNKHGLEAPTEMQKLVDPISGLQINQ